MATVLLSTRQAQTRPSAGTISTSDVCVLPAMDGEPTSRLMAAARERGVITFLDECFGYGPKPGVLELLLPHCDYVTPSIDDLRVIYPGASAEELADRLLAQGAGVAV